MIMNAFVKPKLITRRGIRFDQCGQWTAGSNLAAAIYRMSRIGHTDRVVISLIQTRLRQAVLIVFRALDDAIGQVFSAVHRIRLRGDTHVPIRAQRI